jgi:hypothetical protein
MFEENITIQMGKRPIKEHGRCIENGKIWGLEKM